MCVNLIVPSWLVFSDSLPVAEPGWVNIMSCEEGRPPADVEEVMLCVVVSSCTLPGKLNCSVELPQALKSSSP